MNKAFTLVELAIVIVIIGLLVGGVLQGQALIEASRLNKEITELNSIHAAHNTFFDKYNCIAGDCPNASVFLNNAQCTSMVSFSVTCNGNGNRKYDVWLGSGAPDGGDPMRYWVHLELARMLTGGNKRNNESTYRVSNYSEFAAHYASNGEAFGSGDLRFPYKYNFVAFAGTTAALCGTCSILSPYQAYKIDAKLDDGIPGTGRLKGILGSTTSTSAPSGACLSGSEYDQRNEGLACFLLYSLE